MRQRERVRPLLFLQAGVSALAISGSIAPAAEVSWETWPDTWAATDGLGRKLPLHAETGPVKENRTVGIFYFLWLAGNEPVHDITRILAENPDKPAWGRTGAFHWWGEPLFGYYRSDDPFVIRKHAQMLSDAGVDVLFFDVTNALTYDPAVEAVCRVLTEMKAEGQRVPQIAFLFNSQPVPTVHHLYDSFFKPERFSELWFRWQGKPLLLAPAESYRTEVKEFFTWRRSWAWTKGHEWFGDGRDRWPWLDHTPQSPGWHESPDKPEQIVACLAEHPISDRGRSFHTGREPAAAEERPAEGRYFAEQMERALQVDPPFLFITGWNEWVAQRFIDERGTMTMARRKLKPGDTYFVDQYSQEFSRDAEPMKSGHGDAPFFQLAGAIRRYKGTHALPPCRPHPVEIDGQFADWGDVEPEYRDTLGDPVQRDHPGWQGQPQFVDRSGRNDLAAAKVTHDTERVCFYIRTRAPLTDASAPRWMHLLIDADTEAGSGWLGYDFAVNAQPPSGGFADLAALAPDGKASPAGEPIVVRFTGNELELAVPRSVLRLPAGLCTIHFKWTDNIPLGAPVESFTLTGDAAPNDRFMYRAVLQP